LIVEDDDDARDVLGELISALGHDVVPAATALEALARAADSKIDFALIDLSLGGADGCEVARQIRSTAQGQSVRLVALTGYSDRSKRKEADDAGFDDFIVKPAHMNVIEALLSARAERASAG
jgi:CheY-like chemotaxis protein